MKKEEAIKILKDFHDESAIFSVRTALETLYPEFRESEDEKVRKDCIKYLDWEYQHCSINEDKMKIEKCIAWLERQGDKDKLIKELGEYKVKYTEEVLSQYLEKQGEHKSKFHEGDWIISNNKKSIYQVIEVKRGIYVIRDNADNHEYHIGIEECEKSGRLWSIAGAKEGDVLVASDDSLFIFARVKDNAAYYHYSLCKNGSQEISDGKHAWEVAKDCHPATKEQRDALFAKMKEAGYEWDNENKQLNKIGFRKHLKYNPNSPSIIEQKPTETLKWSAQEEYCICELEAMVKEAWEKAENVRNDVTIKKMQELMFFLKTLNPNKKPQRIISAEAKEAMYDSSAWSEEDEKRTERLLGWLDTLVNYIHHDAIVSLDLRRERMQQVEQLKTWLKPLKQRIGWKPSDEQMNAFKQVYDWYNNNFAPSETLTSLYNHLKKLKENNL